MEFVVRPVGGNALVRDYLDGDPSATAFFRDSPFALSSFTAKAKEVAGVFDQEKRSRALDLLRPAGALAEAALERVRAEDGFLVTTGQQPGLFGGPLYSLYKGLTAIRLAEEAEGVLGVPVMAVFWIASEDHDWDEANHTYALDTNNEIASLSLGERPGPNASPLFRIPTDDAFSSVYETLDQLVPPSDFKEELFERLRGNDGATLPELFEELLRFLFRDFPIAFVQASDPGLKAASAPIIARELATAEQGEVLLQGTARALERAGYDTQVALMEGGVNLFLETEAGRERLYRNEGGGFTTKGSGGSCSAEELDHLLGSDPRRLSPNVLLRPVVESAVFPTLAYVGGPGELAYFGQLKAYFEHLNVGMPLVYPRTSLTIVEAKIQKVLKKFDVGIDQVREIESLITSLAEEELPSGVRRALGEWRGAAGKLSGDLTKAVSEIDPTLKGSVANARNATLAALQDLEKKIIQGVKKSSEISVAQLRKAHTNLWPMGKAQDRVLGPVPYAARYGSAFTTSAYEAVQVELRGESP